MPCKGSYRLFHRFSVFEIIRIRDVSRVFLENRGKKIPVFNNIRIHVDEDMCGHCETVKIVKVSILYIVLILFKRSQLTLRVKNIGSK